MGRDTCLLMPDHLEGFEAYLKDNGWVLEESKGQFEVMRARKDGVKEPLIVHRRDRSSVHLTVWGHSLNEARNFLNYKKGVHYL